MPIVKVSDLAFGRLQSPSLDEAEEFLSRFGMVRAERTKDRLYMRGTDPSPYIHITHLGPSKFLGLGFHVRTEDELKHLNAGASQVKRIAHAVLMTPGASKVTQWYREMVGFIPSDEVYAGPKENIIASFNRCDRGDE